MTMHVRAAQLRPSTLNIEARTVEAIISTGADVARPGYIERLDMRGVNLSRLIGAPVLDGHRRESIRDQVGVVDEAEMRPEGLWGLFRFRLTPQGEEAMRGVADGSLRQISMGYSAEQFTDTRVGKQLIRTLTKFTPLEVSIVLIAADPGAHFRHEETVMDTIVQTAQVQTRAQINAQIRNIANLSGMPDAWANEHVDAEATVEDVRAAAFAEMARAQAASRTRTATAQIGTDHNDPAVIATRAGEALFARIYPDHQLSEPARPFAYMSFVDLARDCLRRRGEPVNALSPQAIIERAFHGTSDFANILVEGMNRVIVKDYQAAPSGVRLLSRQTTARDFRPNRKLKLGEASTLLKVLEGGEFTSGTMADAQESYSLETFGRIFGVSRQVLVNDDLGAFTEQPRRMGIAARAFENDQLTAKIIANPNMSDGVALFHATHGNLGTAGAISVTTLTAARLAMRKQKGLSGMLIDVTPRYLLVPPDLETIAEQQLTALQATTTADVNPFAKLTLVVEPRLTSATEWYLVADPATIDGLEYAYLEGAPGPQIETRVGFEVDAVQVKVRLDFGCGWIDHRGWYRNG